MSGDRGSPWAGILVGLLAGVALQLTAAPAVAQVGPLRAALSPDVWRAAAHAIRNRIDPPASTSREAGRENLTRLYLPAAYNPLWLDGAGLPSDSARDALTLLASAATQGLDPAAYQARPLAARGAVLATATAPAPDDLAAWDVDLSQAMLRYLQHLHLGRLDPKALGFRVAASRSSEHDFVALLRGAVVERRIPGLAADLTPALAQYRGLLAALSRYRALAGDTTLIALPDSPTVRPGQTYSDAHTLQRRLVALADLPTDGAAALRDGMYEGALVEATKRFQLRHGLETDGVLGKATQAALNVPLHRRVRQIELALERMRWLPHRADSAFIAINIPMYTLWAWNAGAPEDAPALRTGVIVGRALRTQTPVFADDMRYLIFRPYWNVPRSILRNEVLPAIARDPLYLRRHDMEIVSGPGDDAQPVEPSADTLAALGQGTLRLRQRPGARNSLGQVKFIFPNDDNVYLHGTPAQQLFARSRRDFSHGCVRVEDPVALAQWVLRDQPQWTRERIVAAMSGTQTRRVDLRQPIPVILYYVTAVVMPQGGAIHFADDIYGHDATLERALARAR